MSQTVRISAGYSDKASENYQSRQYSLNLELDVQVNGSTLEIESASDRLFDFCRRIVEKQKGVSVDNLLQRPEPPVQTPVQHVPVLPAPANGQNNNPPRLCSEKQLKYLWRLGKQAGLTDEQIRMLSIQYYQKTNLTDLTASQASSLIDSLSEKRKAA